MMNGMGMFFGGWWMALVWGLILAGVVWVVRSVGDRPEQSVRTDKTPLQILEERYARGEISEETFTHMRDRLRR